MCPDRYSWSCHTLCSAIKTSEKWSPPAALPVRSKAWCSAQCRVGNESSFDSEPASCLLRHAAVTHPREMGCLSLVELFNSKSHLAVYCRMRGNWAWPHAFKHNFFKRERKRKSVCRVRPLPPFTSNPIRCLLFNFTYCFYPWAEHCSRTHTGCSWSMTGHKLLSEQHVRSPQLHHRDTSRWTIFMMSFTFPCKHWKTCWNLI